MRDEDIVSQTGGRRDAGDEMTCLTLPQMAVCSSKKSPQMGHLLLSTMMLKNIDVIL